MADLWLVGKMVNRIGIYGSKVAEGLSAFQRRSCSSLQYRYVCGWNMRYKRFHLSMDSEPEFYFICAINPPASLCASRPTFNSEDLFTSVSETCMHHGAIRCGYLISLRTKMNRGVSLWNISVCFDYNIQVLWLTSNRCWADVGGRHQPNVMRRWIDIARPISTQRRPNTCSLVVFFHSIICQNYFVFAQRSILVQSSHCYRPTVH